MSTATRKRHDSQLQGERHNKKRFLLLAAVLLTASIGVVCTILAVHRANSTDKYLGTWNYNRPNNQTMTNVATISGGYALNIPQIGTVTFSKGDNGQIIGHTDQGCTWHFTRAGNSLQLTSPTQYCFNHVVNSGYNIYSWKITVNGDSEQETLKATSFLPTGMYNFVLQDGRRTKADTENIASTFRNFEGTWAFAPANPKTQVNIVNLERVQPNGAFAVSQTSQTGSITYTQGSGDTIRARMEDGCTWTLAAHGNTAELLPAHQSCTVSTQTTELTFFAIASNGAHQTAIMAGTHGQNDAFQMIIGSLGK